MAALAERDAAALLAVVAELDALDDPQPFPPHFLGRLAALLRSQDATYSVLDRGRQISLGHAGWYGGTEVVRGYFDAKLPYWRLRHSHPVCSYRERTGDWTAAHTVADFATTGAFRRTAIWDELYRHSGVNHWIDVGLEAVGRVTHVFVFTRDRGEYGERDRLVLDLLQPHLQARFARVEAAEAAADALAELDSDDPGHVVLCSATGAIEFASAESRRLLATYFDCENGHLPVGVLHARGVAAVERDGKRLTVRSAPVGELRVVLLGEEDVRLDRLTARQRTILAHVARGETDAQIGEALGIAPATVGKHLEQIYERLGVHTRTAAAAVT